MPHEPALSLAKCAPASPAPRAREQGAAARHRPEAEVWRRRADRHCRWPPPAVWLGTWLLMIPRGYPLRGINSQYRSSESTITGTAALRLVSVAIARRPIVGTRRTTL